MSMHATPDLAGRMLETWKPDHCTATASKAHQPVDKFERRRYHNALRNNSKAQGTDCESSKKSTSSEALGATHAIMLRYGAFTRMFAAIRAP